MRPKLWSEFFGTFALVFCGTGAIVVNDITGGKITHAGIALTFGLVVMVLVSTFGDTSGAHFNPAITLAFAAARRLSWRCGAQCAGALAASLLLRGLFPLHAALGTTTPRGSVWQSLVLEAVLTWF